MHMMSKKESSSDELDTLRRSRTPHCGAYSQWRRAYKRRGTSFRSRSKSARELEETLAVLSLRKLCEDHGFSNEWVSGQMPRLTKDGKTSVCKTDNFVPVVVPGLSNSSGNNSSETSTPHDLSSTSPAQERSDETSEPLPKKRDRNRDSDDWLEEFTDDLEDTELHAPANGWRSSQTIWRTQKCQCPHTFLRTQVRNVPRMWYQNQGSTVFILTSQKTEIAKYACKQKWQGLLAGGRIGEALPRAEKFGDLITADHKLLNEEL